MKCQYCKSSEMRGYYVFVCGYKAPELSIVRKSRVVLNNGTCLKTEHKIPELRMCKACFETVKAIDERKHVARLKERLAE